MAALTAIVKALSRAESRELGTFLSVRLNNLFLFAALLAYSSMVSGLKPVGSLPFFALLGLVMLFPMSSDLLSRAPRSRLALWPLNDKQRWSLRVATLTMNPLLWLAIVILAATHQPLLGLLFLFVAVGTRSVSILAGRLPRLIHGFHQNQSLPQFPGKLGGMVRLNLLQIFSLLDLYAALLLALSATVYRLQHGKTEPEALSFSAMLVALALSTCAQCQFGLDSGLSRYHLFPIRGWQVLFAKDVAFLIVLVVLVLPLSLGPGLAFGLIAIAVGRYPSLILRPAQSRWRFTGGDLRFGVLQAVAGTAFGFAEYQHGPYFLLVASVLYLLSLFLGGRYWDRTEKL